MRFELNAIYVSRHPDLAAGLATLRDCADEDLLAPMKENPLSLPWDTSVTPRSPLRGSADEAPWVDDDDALSVSDRVLGALAQNPSVTMALAGLEDQVRHDFLSNVRIAAERWMSNMAELARGDAATFESRYANRIDVDPSGSIIFCPEDYETMEPTDANVYGEILMASREVFPGLARAMGIFPLEGCRLSVQVQVAD